MESEANPTAEGGFYAPLPPDMRAYLEHGNITVEGQTFAVRTRIEDGSTHYDWISGPNHGYGFSTSGGPSLLSLDQHSASIRDFLSGIDPATGYLADP